MSDESSKIPANICIFCEWEGKLTGEHIHSQWLHEELQQYAQSPRYDETSRLVPGEHGAEVVRMRKERKNETTLSRQESGTCSGCNNGWMNIDVEQRVAPILMPLVRGISVLHDLSKVQKLAEWVTLKFMIVDAAADNPPTFTKQDREDFFKSRTVPLSMTGIWAAPLSGGPWSAEWALCKSRNISTFTFGVGKVLFYAICNRDPLIIVADRGFAKDRLERIWPARSLNAWPPVGFLNSEEAEGLHLDLEAFRQKHRIKIEATPTVHKLRVTKSPPKESMRMGWSETSGTGVNSSFVGDEYESHCCGGCSYMLLRSLSIDTFRNIFSPSPRPVYLVCPKCGANNVVPVKGTNKKSKKKAPPNR